MQNNEPSLASWGNYECGTKCIISIVMPCLNEVTSINRCISNAREFLHKCGVRGEIIVVDNGSTDGSIDAIISEDIIPLYENNKGYGSACLRGLSAAEGEIVILADSDGTYDFFDAERFLELFAEGCDLVIGSRILGHITPQSMPWLHRYIGVPFLTWMLNITTNCQISDAHCGLRAIRRNVLYSLNLQAKGFELTSEMIIKASRLGLKIDEVPISYYSRSGRSKLRTFRDGLKHFCLILYYSMFY